MARTHHPAISYIRRLYAPEDALLHSIRERLEREKLDWQIGPEEGKLLQMLIRLHGVKTIVEIGTLFGYSALWMARALPEDGHLLTVEKNPEHAAVAREFAAQSDVAARITVHEGDAHEALEALAPRGPFDMLFIDADKPSYNAYLDWGERHVRRGGLIVADNTLLFGSVWQERAQGGVAPSTWEGMRRFNARLADESRYFAVMIPTEQGLSVAIKRF